MENKQISPFTLFLLRFKKQKPAILALIILLLILAIAIFAPLLAPYDYTTPNYSNRLLSPSFSHFAGTDNTGRDVFSRLLFGARVSLSIGFISVTMGMVVGTVLGIIAGFVGGVFDSIVMRIADVLFAFPSILLAIGIVAVLGQGIVNVILAIAIFSSPVFARIVRGSTLAIRNTQYIKAAETMGASKRRIMFIHIFPGTISSILVYFTMRIGTSILTAAGLSYLGLGAKEPSPEWGAMLASGRDLMYGHPYLTIFPGIAIFITVLSFNILGDGLRSALDPKD